MGTLRHTKNGKMDLPLRVLRTSSDPITVSAFREWSLFQGEKIKTEAEIRTCNDSFERDRKISGEVEENENKRKHRT